MDEESTLVSQKLEAPKIYLFQPPDRLMVDLHLSKRLQLDKVRTVEVSIDVGKSLAEKIEMKIKSLTAGLRLLLSEIQIINRLAEDSKQISVDIAEAGVLIIHAEEGLLNSARLCVPYKADNDLTDLSVCLIHLS